MNGTQNAGGIGTENSSCEPTQKGFLEFKFKCLRISNWWGSYAFYLQRLADLRGQDTQANTAASLFARDSSVRFVAALPGTVALCNSTAIPGTATNKCTCQVNSKADSAPTAAPQPL